MKKLKDILLSPVTTIIAFVLSAGLLLFGSVGGAQAALTYFSQTYASRVQMFDIGVTLLENDQRVSWRDYNYEVADGSWDELVPGVLLGNMIDEEKGESLQLGRAYEERLSVGNSGTINQYVRVTVYRYWLDENDEKLPTFAPEWIDLHLTNLGSAWLLDEEASTRERTVLYYNRLLNAGDETPLFADTLTIDGKVGMQVEIKENDDGSTQFIYAYSGAKFCLEAKVDAVQENNAEDAILSAWGQRVIVDEDAGTLTLR